MLHLNLISTQRTNLRKCTFAQNCTLVMKLSEAIKRRRTFAIISHPNAGQPILAEKLLLLWLFTLHQTVQFLMI